MNLEECHLYARLKHPPVCKDIDCGTHLLDLSFLLMVRGQSILNGDINRVTHLLVLELVPSSLRSGVQAVSKADIDWHLFTGT